MLVFVTMRINGIGDIVVVEWNFVVSIASQVSRWWWWHLVAAWSKNRTNTPREHRGRIRVGVVHTGWMARVCGRSGFVMVEINKPFLINIGFRRW
jgi:hypothetical protein